MNRSTVAFKNRNGKNNSQYTHVFLVHYCFHFEVKILIVNVEYGRLKQFQVEKKYYQFYKYLSD